MMGTSSTFAGWQSGKSAVHQPVEADRLTRGACRRDGGAAVSGASADGNAGFICVSGAVICVSVVCVSGAVICVSGGSADGNAGFICVSGAVICVSVLPLMEMPASFVSAAPSFVSAAPSFVSAAPSFRSAAAPLRLLYPDLDKICRSGIFCA